MSSLPQRLEEMLLPALKEQGLGIVRIVFTRGRKGTLQVMIERLDNETVKMEDCVTASREISVLLDVEDPIDTAYSLEVTSPGLDRPLVKPEHFKRFEESLIQVQTFAPFEGRKKFKGTLVASTQDGFTLEEAMGNEETRVLDFSYEEVSKVALVPEYEK